MKTRLAVITGLLAGAVMILATAPAMARTDVLVGIGIPMYVQPAPVHVQPHLIYRQPQPYYVQAQPYYVQPQPYYRPPQPYYRDRYHRQDWRRHHWNGDYRSRHDQDCDGIPNRYDRDRDGDGVPNRFDQRPYDPYRY